MDSLIQNNLKIVVWNAQSLKSKIAEFSNFLNKHKIDLALISETWLNSSIKISIPNFKIYRKDRESDSSHPHGGVAICIRNSLIHNKVNSINLNTIENLSIQIPFKNSNLTVVVIYCPPSMSVRNFKAEMKSLMSLPGPIILGGDVNAKHTSWNNPSNNYKGIELIKVADSNFYDILSSKSATLYPAVGNPSTVDLVFKKGISCLSKLDTVNDLSSDHLPVVFQISSKFENVDCSKFDFGKADWMRYRGLIEDGLSDINLDSTQFRSKKSLDDLIDSFSNLIKNSANLAIPKRKPQSFRYPYSDEISLLKKHRNYYRKLYRNTLNPAFKSCFNQLNKLIKAATTKLNADSWDSKLSKIDYRDRTVFRLAGYLKRKHSEIPPLKDSNDKIAYSDDEKCQIIANEFHKVHENAFKLSSRHRRKVNSTVTELNSKRFTLDKEFYFDTATLKLNIKKLKVKKAPGFDGISNVLIKNLPERALSFMIDLFNGCLKNSYFPDAWKLGKIVAIPKPNKNHQLPSNYRPITLLSCIGKIFERLILSQIIKFLNSKKVLINQQFGFRSGHSTTKQLIRLLEQISFDFNNDLSTGMVCLDVEKAFDSVWHNGLIFKMSEIGFPIHILKIVQSFLCDRKSFVQINNSKSQEFHVRAGVPQGSILSPTLFNIFLNDIPTPKGCVKAIYADDTALKCSFGRHDIERIVGTLQSGLIELEKFFTDWKIKLNHNKTEAILFSHSRIMSKEKHIHKINFNGHNLEWKDEIKYLGMILDPRLTFKLNALNNVKKTKKAISILFPLLKKHNSLDIKTKLIIFKLYLLPILTYACPAWSNLAKCHVNKLQIQQNKILRMVLSAPFSTRITELHSKLNVPYLHEKIETLTLKFYNNLNNNVTNPLIKKLGKYTRDSVPFRIKHKLPKKI